MLQEIPAANMQAAIRTGRSGEKISPAPDIDAHANQSSSLWGAGSVTWQVNVNAMCRMIMRAGSSEGDESILKELISTDTGLADLLTSLQDHHW